MEDYDNWKTAENDQSREAAASAQLAERAYDTLRAIAAVADLLWSPQRGGTIHLDYDVGDDGDLSLCVSVGWRSEDYSIEPLTRLLNDAVSIVMSAECAVWKAQHQQSQEDAR